MDHSKRLRTWQTHPQRRCYAGIRRRSHLRQHIYRHSLRFRLHEKNGIRNHVYQLHRFLLSIYRHLSQNNIHYTNTLYSCRNMYLQPWNLAALCLLQNIWRKIWILFSQHTIHWSRRLPLSNGIHRIRRKNRWTAQAQPLTRTFTHHSYNFRTFLEKITLRTTWSDVRVITNRKPAKPTPRRAESASINDSAREQHQNRSLTLEKIGSSFNWSRLFALI